MMAEQPTQHTPGPVVLVPCCHAGLMGSQIETPGGKHVVLSIHDGSDADLEHFIACWNACDGINPAAVPGLLSLVKRWKEIHINCLKPCREDAECLWCMSEAAIAKAEPPTTKSSEVSTEST